MNLTEINCKELFKNAYERRYTWENKFSGYKGKCIFSANSDSYEGNFVLGGDFKPVSYTHLTLPTTPYV